MEQMKIERISDLFKCKICKKSYTNPIMLPCGNVICFKDIELLTSDGINIDCNLCDREHQKPVDGFPIVKPLAEMMELRADRLSFGKNFEYGKNLLISLEKLLKQFSLINNDPKSFIHDYFNELKKKCNQKRDELKLEIDIHYDHIIKEIDKYQKECDISSKIVDDMFTDIEMYKTNLKDWVKEYDTTSINEESRNRIIFESKSLKLKLDDQLGIFKNKLLKNMNYKIENYDLSDKKKLGYLSVEKLPAKRTDTTLFNYTLENFIDFRRNPASTVTSNSVGQYKWYLRVYITENNLSCYLKCDPNCLKDISLETEFRINLVHLANPDKNVTKESKKNFSPLSFSWGWPKFIPLQDIINGGYYDSRNDSVQLECQIEIKSIEKTSTFNLANI